MGHGTVSPRQYRRITLAALFALTFIIVTGAAVRLTGSGLGCSDWPTCEEDRLVPDKGDLHGMIEFVNRVITGLVSIAVALAVLGSYLRSPRRRDLDLWAWSLVVGVVAQILIGMLVVELELLPGVVMLHFGVSMVLVWCAMVLHHRAALPERPPPARELPAILPLARLVTVSAAAVLLAGAVVTGAGPHAGDERAERLDVAIPTVARIHGVLVVWLVAVVIWLGWTIVRTGAPLDLRRSTRTLLVVLVAQAAVGYFQYFNDVPALLVGVHVAGATAVWISVIALHLRVRHPVTSLLHDAPSRQPIPEVVS